MKKTIVLICILAMVLMTVGACSQDSHNIQNYTNNGYGSGNGNNLPDNNNPNRGNTTTTNNLPPAV